MKKMRITRYIYKIGVVAALMFSLGAHAQFPNDVKDVLKKFDEKMSSYKTDAGLVFDMDLKLKVSVLSLKGSMKTYVKDKKYFNDMSLGVMNKKMKMEMGFDGTQKWSYRTSIDEKKKDSLIITKTQTSKNDYGMKNDYEKEYKKAKMKEVGNYYEITFSGPKQKDIPKDASIKIAKDSYLLREYTVNEDMGSFTGKMTITITKITKGCSDNWFKLDMSRYKNAVVVRR